MATNCAAAHIRGAHLIYASLAALLAVWCGSHAAASPTLREVFQPSPGPFLAHLFTQPIGPLTGGDEVNVAAADWDGDGDIDLFTGSRYGDLLYFQNIGGPTQALFAPAQLMNVGQETAEPGVGVQELAPAVGDLDGDGVLDLLVTVEREVYLYRGGEASVASGTPLQASDGEPLLPEDGAVALADADGDGLLDALIGTDSGRVLLALNVGTPSAAKFGVAEPMRREGAPVAVAGRARVTAWRDDAGGHVAVGGDGGELLLLDITAAEKPGAVTTSQLHVATGALGDLQGEPLSPSAADIDGDGRTDIVLGTGRGFVATLIQQAGSSFKAGEPLRQREAPIDVGSFSAPVLADWDGDGLADLVVGDDAGTIHVFPRLASTRGGGAAEPAFGPGWQLEVEGETIRVDAEPPGFPYEYVQPLVLDWDGDGDVDLLVGGADGRILLFRNVARGGPPKLARPEPLAAGREPIRHTGSVSMYACDWNLDGDLDLFVGSGAHVHGESTLGLLGGLVPSAARCGLVYYENIAVSPRQQPRFFKGARLETRVPVTFPAPALEDADPLDVGIVGITDWDGDGRRDFLISGTLGGVYVCSNRMRPGAYPRLFLAADPEVAPSGKILEGAYACSLADVNGDGREDIVAGMTRYGFVRWFDRDSLPTPVYRQAVFSSDEQCTCIERSAPLPRGGTITSWRIAIGEDNTRTQYRLKVFRANGRYMELVGQSRWRRVKPGWNAFSCTIAGIQRGDLVGFASGPDAGNTVVVAASGGPGLCRVGEDIEADTLLSSWSRIDVRLAIEATVQ